jgi:hypothetical protein
VTGEWRQAGLQRRRNSKERSKRLFPTERAAAEAAPRQASLTSQMSTVPATFSPAFSRILAQQPASILQDYDQPTFIHCDRLEGFASGVSRVVTGPRVFQYASNFSGDQMQCDTLKDTATSKLKWKFDSVYGLEPPDSETNGQRAICLNDGSTTYLLIHYFDAHSNYDDQLNDYRWQWCHANKDSDPTRTYKYAIEYCLKNKLAIKK